MALNNKLCTKCNTNYYPKENDPLNLGEYKKCYKEPEGYYLDNNSLLYKQCYHTCKTCNTSGDYINHNCIQCNINYTNLIENDNASNCYENCNIIILIMNLIIFVLKLYHVLINIQYY